MRSVLVIALLALLAAGGGAVYYAHERGKLRFEPTDGPPTGLIEGSHHPDPVLNLAAREARQSFESFFKLFDDKARPPRWNFMTVALRVKDDPAGLVTQAVTVLERRGDLIIGKIANPRPIEGFEPNELVTFSPAQIVDWQISVGGRAYGGFTNCAGAARGDEAEQRTIEKNKLDCAHKLPG